MANIDENFVVKTGLTVGPTVITAATGNLVTTGNIEVGAGTNIVGATGDLNVGPLNVNGTSGAITIGGQPLISSTGNLAGNADTATKLATARTISLTGAATGSSSFDGSANASITTTLVDSGAAAGAYTLVTVNAKGLVTHGANIGTSEVTTALGFTPYDASNPSGYIAAAGAPVQTVAGRTGSVTLSQADISGLTIASSPTFTAVTATTFNGNVSGSAATVTGAAQSAITSVGTLTGLTSSGAVHVTNSTAATGAGTGALQVAGGASVGGALYIGGNLYVAGTTTTVNSNVTVVAESMLYLASEQPTDVLDIGVLGSYNKGTVEKHTGIIRDASDGVWKFFSNVVDEPTATINFSGATYDALQISALTATTGTFSGAVSASSFTGPVTGNASTATALATARTLSTSGDASGSVSFNGSANADIALTLAPVGTAGTYYKVTTDTKGRVTSGAALTSGDITTALGFTPSATAGTANRIVVADASGYINNTYFNSTDASAASGVTAVMVKAGNNNLVSGTAAAVSTFLGLTSSATTANATANTASTLVLRDASGNFSAGTITATCTNAKYADLAENYSADKPYMPGTVVEFGGSAEITLASADSRTVAGVVSTNPAYTMNSMLMGTRAAVALTGRVPCKVTGKISKGDMMVSAGNGFARAEADPKMGQVIGKALDNFDGAEGVIEVVVGRL